MLGVCERFFLVRKVLTIITPKVTAIVLNDAFLAILGRAEDFASMKAIHLAREEVNARRTAVLSLAILVVHVLGAYLERAIFDQALVQFHVDHGCIFQAM